MDEGARALVAAYPDYCQFKNYEFEGIEQPTRLGYLAPGLTEQSLREFWEWLTVKYGISIAQSPKDLFVEWELTSWVDHYIGYLVSTDVRRLIPELAALLATRDTSVFAAESLLSTGLHVVLSAISGYTKAEDRQNTSARADAEFYLMISQDVASALPKRPEFYASVDIESLYAFMRLASIAKLPEVASAIAEARLPTPGLPVVPISEGGEGDYVKLSLGASGWLDSDGAVRTSPPKANYNDDVANDLWLAAGNALSGRSDRKWKGAPYPTY